MELRKSSPEDPRSIPKSSIGIIERMIRNKKNEMKEENKKIHGANGFKSQIRNL